SSLNASGNNRRCLLLSAIDTSQAPQPIKGVRESGTGPVGIDWCCDDRLAAGSAEALAARKAEQAETQRLKREVKRLEEEVEILRKAAAFFAKGVA
ncbi:hypothetical protein, partial [Dankookia rubra]|uniref:hypothetical protein n=1 Tax=Dankookia rubra TaxID=1442381 RepID=UPI001F4FD4B0